MTNSLTSQVCCTRSEGSRKECVCVCVCMYTEQTHTHTDLNKVEKHSAPIKHVCVCVYTEHTYTERSGQGREGQCPY